MRRLVLSAVAAIGVIATPAFAADLPLKAPAYYAPTWTGFYVGGNFGYAWMSNTASRVDGVIGGGQLGYNQQLGRLVAGLEADIQATSLKGTSTATNGALSITDTTKAPWLGTIRGRLGLSMGAWMPYVTGGVAFANIKHDGAGATGVTGTYSGSNSLTGWTLGGGAEWMFAPKWSAKLEYLHVELPSHTNTYTTTTPAIAVSYGKTRSELVRLGVNYHF